MQCISRPVATALFRPEIPAYSRAAIYFGPDMRCTILYTSVDGPWIDRCPVTIFVAGNLAQWCSQAYHGQRGSTWHVDRALPETLLRRLSTAERYSKVENTHPESQTFHEISPKNRAFGAHRSSPGLNTLRCLQLIHVTDGGLSIMRYLACLDAAADPWSPIGSDYI